MSKYSKKIFFALVISLGLLATTSIHANTPKKTQQKNTKNAPQKQAAQKKSISQRLVAPIESMKCEMGFAGQYSEAIHSSENVFLCTYAGRSYVAESDADVNKLVAGLGKNISKVTRAVFNGQKMVLLELR